jgi:hypothetical protein
MISQTNETISTVTTSPTITSVRTSEEGDTTVTLSTSTSQHTSEDYSQSSTTSSLTLPGVSSLFVQSSASSLSTSSSNQSVPRTTSILPQSRSEILSGALFAPGGAQSTALALGIFAAFGVFFIGKISVRTILESVRKKQ